MPVIPEDSEFVRLIKKYSQPDVQLADEVSPLKGKDLFAWIGLWSAVVFAYFVAGLIAAHLVVEVYKRLP